MRVACVNQDSGIAPERKKGAAVHLCAIRKALAAEGAEVFAIDAAEGDAVESRLAELEDDAPLDLIYERFALGATAAASYASRRNIPLVLEMNAPLSTEAARWRGTRIEEVRDAEEFVARRATRILAVSNLVAEYARELGADPGLIQVVPNGVDLTQFRRRTSDDLRGQLVPDGRLAIGFHGRLRPWHGFSGLVANVAELIELNVPVHLVIVGEGDFERHFVGRIPDEHVTRIGWIPHDRVGDYVAAFDVLPLSYSPESPCYFSPLKLMEAMACGVVPLVPDLGDLGTLVEHDASGLVFRAGDAFAQRDALRLLAVDEALRGRLSAGAIRRAGSFQWASIARVILAAAAPSESLRAADSPRS